MPDAVPASNPAAATRQKFLPLTTAGVITMRYSCSRGFLEARMPQPRRAPCGLENEPNWTRWLPLRKLTGLATGKATRTVRGTLYGAGAGACAFEPTNALVNELVPAGCAATTESGTGVVGAAATA